MTSQLTPEQIHAATAGFWLAGVWRSIRQRCYNPRAANYPYYGGRGITVCDEWRDDPLAFVLWAVANGWQKGLQLDRVDVDGDYSPSNCRYVSASVNVNNRRCSVLKDGRPLSMLAAEHGVPATTAHLRVNKGWDPIAAATTPPIRRYKKLPLMADGRSFAATAEANGIRRGTAYHRLELGWSVKDAATLPMQHTRERTPMPQLVRAELVEQAHANGIRRRTLYKRLSLGWPLDLAITVPPGGPATRLRTAQDRAFADYEARKRP